MSSRCDWAAVATGQPGSRASVMSNQAARLVWLGVKAKTLLTEAWGVRRTQQQTG